MAPQRTARAADAACLPVLTPRAPAQRGGIVTLRLPDGPGVVRNLKERGFVVSYRDGIRVAPHFYNTDEELSRFMDALIHAAREAT